MISKQAANIRKFIRLLPFLVKTLCVFCIFYLLINIAVFSLFDMRQIEVFFRPKTNRNFSVESWVKNESSRYEMIDDLMSKDQLLNLSEEKLTAKLGQPSYVVVSENMSNSKKFAFLLGSQSAYPSKNFAIYVMCLGNLDAWVLVIEIESGHVVDYYLSTV